MVYKTEILNKVDIINKVLTKLKKPIIFENPDFNIDEMSDETYLQLNFVKDECVRFDIKISLYDIQIGVDRIVEAFTWPNMELEHKKSAMTNLIEQLLTNTIRIEYCGNNYTKLYLLNSAGELTKSLKYVTGLYIKISCKIKEYKPPYSN